MNDIAMMMLASLAGGALGAMFFGGLWWTVRRGAASPRPVRWFLGSLLARMSIAMAGFYVIGNGDWQRLLACLVGFIAARMVVTRCVRRPVEHCDACTRDEAGHAS